MQLIVITPPSFFAGEARILTRLFQEGMPRLHLRKPGACIEAHRRLLDAIPMTYHPQIVLHDHFELTAAYPLGGIHLNSRNNALPADFTGGISRSCHTPEEVQAGKAFDYVFLSPVFPSISKAGYGSGFPMDVLREAARTGVINEQVIALGGIDTHRMPVVESLRFGGVAILGALWGKEPATTSETTLLKRYKQFHTWL